MASRIRELSSLTFRHYSDDFIASICQAIVENALYNTKVEYDIEKCTIIAPVSEIFIIATWLSNETYTLDNNS